MLTKASLNRRVTDALLKNDFEVMLSRGIFDIAGKREYKLLIKTLINIDGFLERHAKSLKVLSHFLSANPLVVSLKANKYILQDMIVYSRFNIPVMTPETLETLLFEDSLPYIYSVKGKHLVRIDSKKMKRRRTEMGLSMKSLANKVGVSVKAIYEIENERVNPTLSTAKKLEEILGVKLILTYGIDLLTRPKEDVRIPPLTLVEKRVSRELQRIGLKSSCVYHPKLNVIGKGNFTFASCVKEKDLNLQDEATFLKEFKIFFECDTAIILKEIEGRERISDVPVLTLHEIEEVKNTRELLDLLKEKMD